jgi:hypothetical protein
MFLVGNTGLTFGDYRLLVIKQVHNESINGLDIITIYIYQLPLVWDSLIFKAKFDGLNCILTKFCQKMKCYWLQIMWQNNVISSKYSKLWTISQNFENIHFINITFLKMSFIKYILSYLFYTNVKKLQICISKDTPSYKLTNHNNWRF